MPYGIKAQIKYYDVACELLAISTNGTTYATTYGDMECLIETFVEDCKPYLFPLSSMTEEQCEKFKIISGWDGEWEDIKRGKFSCIGYIGLDYIYDTIDWLNKNHFDYRGLIEKGLAIDCTNLNIY